MVGTTKYPSNDQASTNRTSPFSKSYQLNDEIQKKLGDFKENVNFISHIPMTGSLKTHSNLYDFDKIKRKLEANHTKRFMQNCFVEYSGEKLPDGRRYVTLDNIEVDDNLISVSQSIQYICKLIKAKSEIEQVNNVSLMQDFAPKKSWVLGLGVGVESKLNLNLNFI